MASVASDAIRTPHGDGNNIHVIHAAGVLQTQSAPLTGTATLGRVDEIPVPVADAIRTPHGDGNLVGIFNS